MRRFVTAQLRPRSRLPFLRVRKQAINVFNQPPLIIKQIQIPAGILIVKVSTLWFLYFAMLV
jgi:hypothetical protein